MSDQRRASCSAITKAGRRCRARPRPDGDLCPFHDPRVDLDAARRRGGQHKSTVARLSARMPADLRDVVDGLAETFAETRSGEVSPARAQALASLARALVSAYGEYAVEARVAAMEARLDALTGPTTARSGP